MLNNLRDLLVIRKSGYFSLRYYLLRYPDIRKSDVDPLLHYVRTGWKEGRYPSQEWEDILTSGQFEVDQASRRNPLVAYIEREREANRTTPAGLLKILVLYYRFLFSFLVRKGIVIYGGYPYPEREKDGYYQRIRAIDSLFTDRWRIYVDSVRLEGRDFWYDIPEPRVLVLRPHGKGVRRLYIEFWMRMCILQSRTVYFQSILSTAGREFFWQDPKIRKILDVHGAVPEEFMYQGNEANSRIFDKIEATAVQAASQIVVVSEAMRTHLLNKYPGQISGQFIILPNIPEIQVEPLDKPYIDGKPVIIYAGGVQVWQQIPKIVEIIHQTSQQYIYRLFTPSPEDLKAMFSEDGHDLLDVVIESKKRDEIYQEYKSAHYGFILREDRVVNQVSCPTKLVEYLAMGVVPIVDSPRLGDFTAFGMQYVCLEQFLNHSLPSEQDRQRMAEGNSSVYNKILYQYKFGAKTLQQIIVQSGTPEP